MTKWFRTILVERQFKSTAAVGDLLSLVPRLISPAVVGDLLSLVPRLISPAVVGDLLSLVPRLISPRLLSLAFYTTSDKSLGTRLVSKRQKPGNEASFQATKAWERG